MSGNDGIVPTTRGPRRGLLILAALFCAIGLVLLSQGPTQSSDALVVIHDGQTREVPIDDEIVDELLELTGPGGVLSRDPGVAEAAEELAARRERGASAPWALWGGIASLVLAAGFFLMGISDPQVGVHPARNGGAGA